MCDTTALDESKPLKVGSNDTFYYYPLLLATIFCLTLKRLDTSPYTSQTVPSPHLILPHRIHEVKILGTFVVI